MKIKLLAAIVATPLATMASPYVHWLTETHDFGAFNETDGIVTAVFRYVNTGDSPLVITCARANCGCTTPRYNPDALAPGDTASISVSYDPSGRPGRFVKKIFIDTNTDPHRSTLTISGTVIGAPSTLDARYPVAVGQLRLERNAALLGTVSKGHVKSVFYNIYNASTDTLRPVVTHTPRWLQASIVPPAIAPGQQATINFFVQSSLIPLYDINKDTITITPGNGCPDILKLPVVVTLTDDFAALTDKQRAQAPVAVVSTHHVDPVKLVGNTPATTSFTIRNDGKSPLKLQRLYTTQPGVTTNIKAGQTVKPGKTTTVTITVAPDVLKPDGKPFGTTLVLITNDPTTPKSTILVPITR